MLTNQRDVYRLIYTKVPIYVTKLTFIVFSMNRVGLSPVKVAMMPKNLQTFGRP